MESIKHSGSSNCEQEDQEMLDAQKDKNLSRDGQSKCLSAKLPRRRKRGTGLQKQPQQEIDKKKVKRITKCPHTSLPFYAKGMCKNCYH